MALKTFTTADGSANQALVTNGSGVLSFAAVGASAGQVIQVLTATDETTRTITSGSFVTGSNTLSVTITPGASANKFFITCTGTMQVNGGCCFTIFRDATNLGNANGLQFIDSAGNGDPFAISILDTPNTTSSITYQLYFRNTAGAALNLNSPNAQKNSITVFEIKG